MLPTGRHRTLFPGTPVPGAGRRFQGRVHVQGGPHQVVRRRRVLQTVHARPVRRGQHVQREHDGHRHGGRVRGHTVHRGQAVLPGRQGLSPGGHAGPVPRRPDRPVPGHGQDVHRGRVVPGHVRLRQLGRGRRRVLLVVGGAGVQAAGRGQETAAAARRTGRRREPPAVGRASAAAGPVRPPPGHRRLDRPVVQAAVPARAVRARRMGGAGPGQGHQEGQGLEDGQVRVPARVHRRAGARRRQQRHRVPAADGHAGQVPKHGRRVQPQPQQQRHCRR